GYRVDRRGVQVVQLLPAAADGDDEPGLLQHRQVLADRLAGHVESGAQFAQTLAGPLVEAVQQLPAGRVGQRPEYVVHHMSIALPAICSLLAAFTIGSLT